MLYIILRGEEELTINYLHWLFAQKLAVGYGWRPHGTKPAVYIVRDPVTGLDKEEKDEDWDGNYYSTEYQLVTEEDASNLANALEDALDDPEAEWGQDAGYESFVESVRDLIKHCRLGGGFILV